MWASTGRVATPQPTCCLLAVATNNLVGGANVSVTHPSRCVIPATLLDALVTDLLDDATRIGPGSLSVGLLVPGPTFAMRRALIVSVHSGGLVLGR